MFKYFCVQKSNPKQPSCKKKCVTPNEKRCEIKGDEINGVKFLTIKIQVNLCMFH